MRRSVGALLGLLILPACMTATEVSLPRDRKQATTTELPTTTTTVKAPSEWGVAGTEIVDQHGERLVPVGVNLLGPHTFWPHPTAGHARAAREVWRFNTVRLNTCLPRGCEGTGALHRVNDDLDALVDEYTGAGLVVILSQHQFRPGSIPDDTELAEIEAWWRDVARRFRGRHDVWFNPLNEPGNGIPAPTRWLDVHRRLLTAIRSEGASNIVVLDGTQWGQEAGVGTTGPVGPRTSAILAFGPRLAEEFDDVVFSLHVYDQWAGGSSDADRDARLGQFIDAVHAAGLPLLIGETGGYADHGDPRLDRATTAAYRVAPGRGVGILAWHGRPGDGFALTTPGGFEAVDDPVQPTNLTWHGALLWALAHQ